MNSFRSESIEEQRSKSVGSARYSIVDKIQLRRKRSERRNKSSRNDLYSWTDKVVPLGTVVNFDKGSYSERAGTDISISMRKKI